MTQGSIVAFLIAGISWLAHITHAVPYMQRLPTVVSQEANLVFGPSAAGQLLFFLVQAAAALDPVHRRQHQLQRLPVPDQLRRRGLVPAPLADQARPPAGVLQRDHRADRARAHPAAVVGSNVNALVPFYAIGVFTGVLDGRVRHGQVPPQDQGAGLAPSARHQLLGRACYTSLVVVIFAVVKFTEGAWLIVIIFPLMVFALIRLNRPVPDRGRGARGHRRAQAA